MALQQQSPQRTEFAQLKVGIPEQCFTVVVIVVDVTVVIIVVEVVDVDVVEVVEVVDVEVVDVVDDSPGGMVVVVDVEVVVEEDVLKGAWQLLNVIFLDFSLEYWPAS
jgi:hypothetical protein